MIPILSSTAVLTSISLFAFLTALANLRLNKRVPSVEHQQELVFEPEEDIAFQHPDPIWVHDQNGTLTWSNAACEPYEDAIKALQIDLAKQPETQRIQLESTQSDRGWFDVRISPNAQGTICFARSADAQIQVENSGREFIQTLSQTFAHLSTGLAIFDRDRRLALFNPALLDLTNLNFETLSRQPMLSTFLDYMRETGKIPEPRNYAVWRKHITDLEIGANDGTYCANWELSSGQTYRVVGRPHPDGAIALLIEDISAEMSVTRRYTSELSEYRAIIDSIENPIAVFTQDGLLSTANQAYCEYWGQEPDATLSEVSILDSMKLWQAASLPNPAWGDVRDFVFQPHQRAEWSTPIQLTTGACITMRCMSLAGNKSLVEFIPDAPVQKQQLRLAASAVF